MNYYRYWGKAKKISGKEGDGYHLLPYHCLDVAAVGYCLLDPGKKQSRSLARQLNVEPEWLQDWFSFCLMLHDLGKFFRAFQNLVPNLSPSLVPLTNACTTEHRHDSLGFCLWKKKLTRQLSDIFPKELKEPVSSWIEIVCGHHGQPPLKSMSGLEGALEVEDESAAEQFVRELTRNWLPDLSPLSQISKEDFRRVSWQLAGLAVLADWLGSDQDVFEYSASVQPLEVYWQKRALPQAEKVLAKAEFLPRSVAPFTSIKDQFDFIDTPTPLQEYSQRVSISDKPQLFLLEDVTGAGKTEAAMTLVHRLMSAGQADGLYVGLPTMATANAMYDRLQKSYQALYSDGEKPSMVLAHGASQLLDKFRDSVALSQQKPDKNYARDDISATAYCNAWLADNRKKALLADVGIGTIDQALLGILPARHQSLRLLGLTGKVLLVDEVHAYDDYMQSLLQALLKAHAAQGGSAILLSATLPEKMREQLLANFAEGRGISGSVAPQNNDYPLATRLCEDGLTETAVPTRQSVTRTVNVIRLNDESSALERIRQAVADGHCICWIRNTVDDARNAFQTLSEQDWMEGEKLTLFHSRYAMIDRQGIEGDVLERFGSQSVEQQRRSQVLIATQVVEQSLDLDFDVLISDLAPVDLLIQRAGRLQRHIRDVSGNRLNTAGAKDQRDPPCLYLLCPDPDNVEHKDWLRALLPGTQSVYSHVGKLWLTARAVLTGGGFSMPGDARRLIESVYGEAVQENIPDVLDEASLEAEAEQKSRRGMGRFNQLELQRGYTHKSAKHNRGWDEDVNIPTRLSENDSVSVLLARVENDQLKPYADHEEHGWLLSKINLPKRDWDKARENIPLKWQDAIEQLKTDTPTLKWQEILPLTTETESFYQAEGGWNVGREPR